MGSERQPPESRRDSKADGARDGRSSPHAPPGPLEGLGNLDVQRSLKDVPARVTSSIARERGQGNPLPRSVAAPLESQLGDDLSQVRVHTDAPAAGLADSLHARAFT